MYDSKSCRTYLERRGLLDAYRRPEPQLEPDQLKVHTLPLEAPLPLPTLLLHADGEPESPDRGQTQRWPHQETGDD